MVAERTEGVALRGTLPITIDGVDYVLPTLKIKRSIDWNAMLADVITRVELPTDGGADSLIAAVLNAPIDEMVRLVDAFDKGKLGDEPGVLGGPDAIMEHADAQELYDALRAMVKSANPWMADLHSVVAAYGPRIADRLLEEVRKVAATMAIASHRVLSSPTPSGTGTSTPTRLPSASQTSSSSSSGRTTRSASGRPTSGSSS